MIIQGRSCYPEHPFQMHVEDGKISIMSKGKFYDYILYYLKVFKWYVEFGIIWPIDDFIWKMPMHIKCFWNTAYSRFWYNPLFFCGGNRFLRMIGLRKLMMKVYGYKD